MSTDRELLEAAAKAAGVKVGWRKNAFELEYSIDLTVCGNRYTAPTWNPLTDDGDALRLAVQIGPLEFSISEYGTAARRPRGEWFGCEAHLHGGKQAATRRAIVRAAASMAPQEKVE